MRYVYGGVQITFNWTIWKKANTVKEDFDQSELRVILYGPADKYYIPVTITGQGDVAGQLPEELPAGVYSMKAFWTKKALRANGRVLESEQNCFIAVTYNETEVESTSRDICLHLQSAISTYGKDGLSAYEIAILLGQTQLKESEWSNVNVDLAEAEHERVLAEEARDTAEDGRVTAEQGRVSAETGRVSAEESRVAAEASRVEAESARVAAETARGTAETARENAEDLRELAETARGAAESSRRDAEDARELAEQAREDAFDAHEAARQAVFETSEASRAQAFSTSESARTAYFNTTQAARQATFESSEEDRTTTFGISEAERAATFNQNENARAVAEAGRVSAEQGRVSAEQGRVSAEASRVSAEQGRVSAEASRVTAEEGRLNAEASRVTAEEAREAAEEIRQENYEETIKYIPQELTSLQQVKAKVNLGLPNDTVFDVSKFNEYEGELHTYADLTAALEGLPAEYHVGGVSIKFINSVSGKYETWTLMDNSWSSDVADWQGVDDEPTAGSENLVKSGGVQKKIDDLNNAINGIVGIDDEQIDLSSYQEKNGTLSVSSGQWASVTSSSQHIYVPVIVGRTYVLTSGEDPRVQYALLKSESEAIISGETPDYCAGWTKPLQMSNNDQVSLVIPNDCNILYLRTKTGGVSVINNVVLEGIKGEIPIIKERIDVLESHASSIDDKIESIDDALADLTGYPDEQIDLSSYISNAAKGNISFTTKTWGNITDAHLHIVVPVTVGRTYDLTASTEGGLSLRYALLKSYTGTSTAPDYCFGWDRPVVYGKGVISTVVIPNDCNFIYFEYKNNSDVVDLSVILKGSDGIITSMSKDVTELQQVQDLNSYWKGKKIAWFGTSIPAGSNFQIPIKGNSIKAFITSYKVEETDITSETNLPCEYPVIAASLLGADTIYNESVGSSRIVKNTTDQRLLIRCKALTNTVQEICSYIWGSYNIDIANQTWSENHNNTIGITEWLTTAGTWSSFVNNIMLCLSQSYQIKLALRHLISDSTQRSSYVNDIFGTYYNDVVSMLSSVGYHLADLVGYGETDLFVLEHSVNDSNPSMDYLVDSTDVTTFQGAYNKIIGEILRYKPSARIAIVSNYGPDSTEIQYDKDKTTKLKEIAEHWQIAFCEMRKYINVSATKQMTQGYWEQNANIWHDSGFQWTEDIDNDSFTTNAYIHPNLYSSSLATIKQNINPRQIHGVWYWEAPARYIWMRDALHPHSDNSGRLCIILAKTLAKWLNVLGNI